MEPISYLGSAVLSGFIYDKLQQGATSTKEYLKEKLKDWIIDDATVHQLATQIDDIGLDEDMSPRKIEKELNASPDILELLKTITPSQTTSITNHQENIYGNNVMINHNGKG